MRLPELRSLLRELNELGFVPSERKGPTGVGYTLEKWLGVSEKNLPIPDIDGRVEIKATRIATNNLITLFTFNKSAWARPHAEIIRRWGYKDDKGRPSLYSTVSATEANKHGLLVKLPPDGHTLTVVHEASGETLASWDLYHLVGKFMAKFERLLLVHAASCKTSAGEFFHYNEARLLAEPSSQTFRNSFASGKALVDIRMHHPKGRGVRNHGTGFRVHEQDLPSLFGRNDDLLS